ncbi:MAG: trypsin-like peptidase domain-containing protein [Dehalococcoidia bacterium]
MADEYGGRERRATDGLNWVRESDGTPPSPVPPAAPSPAPAASGRGPGLGVIAAVAGVSALVGGLVVAAGVLLFDGGAGDDDTNGGTGQGGTLTVEQTSAVADAAARARPAVIKLQSTRRTAGGTEQDVGSGVLIDRDGYVATNAHVVLGTDTLKAILPDGSERPAVLVGHDYPFTDVAVVLIGPTNLAPLEVGDSSALKLGETILAIGNPLAEFEGTVTVGIVSGLNRRRTFDGVVQRDLIQTDAAINSGNSGGALVNLRGQFVGMPTSVLRQGPSSAAAVEGISFALPSNRVMQIVNGIIAAKGQYPRPTLGLEWIDITPETLPRLRTVGLDHGAVVTVVAPGGPAANAGIERGDVITRIGDVELAADTPLMNALLPLQAEQTVKVVLNRGGRIIETDVRLVRRT